MSTDHPGLPFVQAKFYGRGRPDGPPLWIVVHDMEASEYSGRAESTAAYFANPGDGRVVSSHYCVDDDSVVQCVALADVAWTVGNRPGNNLGINWELAGFARQTRDEWLDPFGRAMFARMAPYVRADAARYGIPLRQCSIADLKAYRPGITSHNDLRLAFAGTDHTDPGPAFPWDYFLTVMAGGSPASTQRGDVMYFFSVGPSQFCADPTFERYWAFDNTARWIAVRAAAGNPPIASVASADVIAGLYGQYQGVYAIPRKPTTVDVDVELDDEQLAALLAGTAAAAERGAEKGAADAIDGATIQVGEG